MADNKQLATSTDGQTQPIAAAISLEELRPLLKEIIAEELNTALGAILNRLEKNEQVAGENSRRVSEAFMRITALDLSYRDLQSRSAEAINIANQIVGKFNSIQEMLDTWVEAAANNGKAIIGLQESYRDMQQDIYGDASRPHSKSIMGELDKLPIYIKGAIKEELNPVVNRLAINEARTVKAVEWIEKQKVWQDRAKAVSTAIFSRKTLTGIVSAILTITATSAATGTNYFEGLLLWIQRNLLGGG